MIVIEKTPVRAKINGGFTLIELLVAMAIFLIVITVVMQIFVINVNSAWRLFGKQNSLDSARYILESLSKEVRLSAITTLDSGGSSVQTLDIVNSKDCVVQYRFTANNLTRRVTGGTGCTVTAEEALNPDEVIISVPTSGFYIKKTGLTQPRVTVVIRVKNNDSKTSRQVQIDLQTTVSSRKYD